MLLEANMLQDSDKEITIEEYVQCIHDAGKDAVSKVINLIKDNRV